MKDRYLVLYWDNHNHERDTKGWYENLSLEDANEIARDLLTKEDVSEIVVLKFVSEVLKEIA